VIVCVLFAILLGQGWADVADEDSGDEHVEEQLEEQPSIKEKESTVEKSGEKRKISKYAAVNETNDFIRAIVERCNSQKYLSTPKERTCVHKVC